MTNPLPNKLHYYWLALAVVVRHSLDLADGLRAVLLMRHDRRSDVQDFSRPKMSTRMLTP
jgi:hypothetical protein